MDDTYKPVLMMRILRFYRIGAGKLASPPTNQENLDAPMFNLAEGELDSAFEGE